MKYKAIVFDYAGVVAGDTGLKFDQNISKIIDVKIADYKKIYYRHNNLHNIGKISWEELWRRVLFDMDKIFLLEEVLTFVKKPKKINKNIIFIIKKLKSDGYKTALFSNYSKEGGRRMREVEHLDKIFDLMLISGETGLAKPNRDAFYNLIDVLEVNAKEIVFIDDSPKNIETAHELGITTILCEDSKNVRQQLKEKGIL
ncbi:MAG: HAD-IA family hydrolase [Candidatus Shapirobacteria bacterium]